MTATYRVENRRLAWQAARPASQHVALQLLNLVIQLTPKVTGTLRDGWHIDWDAPSWVISNNVSYGRAVEFGWGGAPGAAMMGTAAAEIKGAYGIH